MFPFGFLALLSSRLIVLNGSARRGRSFSALVALQSCVQRLVCESAVPVVGVCVGAVRVGEQTVMTSLRKE